MNFDLQQVRDLDFDNMGSWPKRIKIVMALVLFTLVMLAGYFFFVCEAIGSLTTEQNTELRLKEEFQKKYRIASNLPWYQAQFKALETQYEQLLTMLPSQNEMPGLLDDITFVATDSGLKLQSLNWDSAIQRDFYLELPIKLSVVGQYHQLGNMLSGVARLPRIVSLHDFTITRNASGALVMDMLAKTYRFKQDLSGSQSTSPVSWSK